LALLQQYKTIGIDATILKLIVMLQQYKNIGIVATIDNIVGIVATIGITATFGTFIDYNNA